MSRNIVISGPMFQRKTKSLITIAKGCDEDGTKCVVIKHSSDTRFTEVAVVVSHDGDSYPCLLFEDLQKLAKYILTLPDGTVVMIDEFNFFSGNAEAFFKALVNKDIWLRIYGLDLDSSGETWPTMNVAHAYADRVIKMPIGRYRGKDPVKFTQKLRSTGHKVDVAGEKMYDAVTASKWTPMS